MENQEYSQMALGRSRSVSFDSPAYYLPTQETQDLDVETPIHRKEIFDRVYGQIIFPPVLGLFIDTPQVQRLRDLKQVGNTHYVYPSTTHTRFEHCLGVSHLGMRFLKQIYENQREIVSPMKLLNISEGYDVKDLWCVGIAGLCHDLGHGPLSHMFEKYVNAIRTLKKMRMWSHEDASILMLRSIWKNRHDELRRFELDEKDLKFVELLIRGLGPLEEWPEAAVGRPPSKRFMTEIIANKRNGLDVDKLDYIQRDSLSCFGSCALSSIERIFQGAYVFEYKKGHTEICYQNKLKNTIEEVFMNRTRLFRLVYQHRVTQVMDQMTLDAFMAADEFFMIIHEGKEYRLSETVDHPGAYLQTGDWVLSAIRYSTKPELEAARVILNSIQCRHIYKTLIFFITRSREQAKGITARDFISTIESCDLKENMKKWEKENGLCPIVIMELSIYKASKDLGDVDPISRIHFLNTRLNPAEAPFSNDQFASDTPNLQDQFRVIVVSRMPLNINDSNALISAFQIYTSKQGIQQVISRAETPVRSVKRHREGSYAEESLFSDPNGSQGAHLRTPRSYQTNIQPPVMMTHFSK